EDAVDRPSMSTVVVMLASDTMALPNPNHPAFSVGRKVKEEESTSKDSKDLSVNESSETHTHVFILPLNTNFASIVFLKPPIHTMGITGIFYHHHSHSAASKVV
ncbi:Receptor-like serine/threonine-protein kinase SD1-7, partial [Mucuna pruriens]